MFSLPVSCVAIGKNQNQSQMYFAIAGVMNQSIPFISKTTVQLSNITNIKTETVFYDESTYCHLAFQIAVDPLGQFAVGATGCALLIFDLVTLRHSSMPITWPHSTYFRPYRLVITTHFLYIAGYHKTNELVDDKSQSKVRYYVHLMSLPSQKFDTTIRVYDTWLSDWSEIRSHQQPLVHISIDVVYDDIEEKVLVGIPMHYITYLFCVNLKSAEVFHLQNINSIVKEGIRGFGMAVAWLNLGQKVAISTTNELEKLNILEIYDMNDHAQFINETTAFINYPNKYQKISLFVQDYSFLVATSSSPSGLFIQSIIGKVLFIPPSEPGYYSVEPYVICNSSTVDALLHSFIPNFVPCPLGTYKNDGGIWPCSPCRSQVNISDVLDFNNSVSQTCSQCTAKQHCPLEFTVSLELLEDVQQNTDYPETPEIDVFDDILLYHIFRTDCPLNSPFYISLMLLFFVLIISVFLSIMKLYKSFTFKRHNAIILTKHFDLIGEGKLWFGGLISIVLLCLAGFSARFSYIYHHQYPADNPDFDDNSCQLNNLRNAKFDTSLQYVNLPFGHSEQMFNLLNSQEFTLNVEFINTSFHCGQFYIENKLILYGKSIPLTCFKRNFNLYASAKLPSHSLNIDVTLIGEHKIEAVRLGLSGLYSKVSNNWVHELNFSKVFNQSDYILSPNPIIHLHLTKMINITEGLTNIDETTYGGLWIPTFTFDIDQLFQNATSPNIEEKTILSLSISETPFYIRNKQQPIARRSEIIFHTLLFVGICIDLVAMMFLLLKLWFIPLIKLLIRKRFQSNSWVFRLIDDKKVFPEITLLTQKVERLENLENELKEIKQDVQCMSARINTLVELLSPHSIQ